MKRREIIKLSLLKQPAATLVASASVFGIPASLAHGAQPPLPDPLFLPIEDNFLPPQVRSVSRSVTSLIASLTHSEIESAAFNSNPEATLKKFNLNCYRRKIQLLID